MSIKLMTHVWSAAPYEGAQLLLLLAIADMSSDDEGKSWASTTTLAKRARCSQRWVTATLREFERDGWLRNEQRPGRSSIYYLRTPEVSSPPNLTSVHP